MVKDKKTRLKIKKVKAEDGGITLSAMNDQILDFWVKNKKFPDVLVMTRAQLKRYTEIVGSLKVNYRGMEIEVLSEK